MAEAVRSRKTFLDAPSFLPLDRDDRGVKKRVNVRGVTVGRFLGLSGREVIVGRKVSLVTEDKAAVGSRGGDACGLFSSWNVDGNSVDGSSGSTSKSILLILGRPWYEQINWSPFANALF